jgi:hypothetical protein
MKRLSQNVTFRKNVSCLKLEAMMEVGNTARRNQLVMDRAPGAGDLVKTRTNIVVDKLK